MTAVSKCPKCQCIVLQLSVFLLLPHCPAQWCLPRTHHRRCISLTRTTPAFCLAIPLCLIVQQNMFLTITTTICQCSSPFSLWPPPPYQVASTDAMLRLSRKPVSHLNRYSSKGHFCIKFVKALILFQLLCGTSLDIAKLVPPTWSSPWARIEPSVLGGHHLGVMIKSAIIIILLQRFVFIITGKIFTEAGRGAATWANSDFHYLCSGVMTKNLFHIIETVSNNQNCFK